MNRTSLTKRQKLSTIIAIFPFLCAVVFLIIGLFTLDDIFLEKNFSLDFTAVVIFTCIHLSFILLLKRLDKIEIDLPKSTLKKIFSIFAYIFLFITSNFLLVMGLKMNLNYWLKNNIVENIELIVIDKNVSYGKATDYYIIFNSNNGKLKNKVRRKNFDTFSIGETYRASVNEGFFHGYFLTEPMKRINN